MCFELIRASAGVRFTFSLWRSAEPAELRFSMTKRRRWKWERIGLSRGEALSRQVSAAGDLQSWTVASRVTVESVNPPPQKKGLRLCTCEPWRQFTPHLTMGNYLWLLCAREHQLRRNIVVNLFAKSLDRDTVCVHAEWGLELVMSPALYKKELRCKRKSLRLRSESDCRQKRPRCGFFFLLLLRAFTWLVQMLSWSGSWNALYGKQF